MKNNKRWCEKRSSKSRLTFHCITVLCMSRDVHSGKRVRHVYDIFLHLTQLNMLILSKLDLHLHVYTGISWWLIFFSRFGWFVRKTLIFVMWYVNETCISNIVILKAHSFYSFLLIKNKPGYKPAITLCFWKVYYLKTSIIL